MDAKAFFYHLGRQIYHLDAIYAKYAKKSQVAPTLLWILYALNDGNIHTQREICQDWDLPKSTVNTIIMVLKAKGYITLEPIKGQRREMTIEITPSGKSYAESLLTEVYSTEAKAFTKLTNEDIKIIEILEKLNNNLKELGE